MSEPRVITLVVDHEGLPPIPQQREALAAAGIVADDAREMVPRTGEDWFYGLSAVLGPLGPSDTIAVADLLALGVDTHTLLASLEHIAATSAQLVALDEGIDTRVDDSFLTAVGVLIGAINAGQDARTRQYLATSGPGRGKTPPRARFVPIESYDRVRNA